MAEIFQFVLPPCATPDLENAVEALKAQFGADLGAFALVVWNRRGTEYNTAYSSGPIDIDELPTQAMEALQERLEADDEEIDFIMETNDNVIEKLNTIGIVRDDDTP